MFRERINTQERVLTLLRHPPLAETLMMFLQALIPHIPTPSSLAQPVHMMCVTDVGPGPVLLTDGPRWSQTSSCCRAPLCSPDHWPHSVSCPLTSDTMRLPLLCLVLALLGLGSAFTPRRRGSYKGGKSQQRIKTLCENRVFNEFFREQTDNCATVVKCDTSR